MTMKVKLWLFIWIVGIMPLKLTAQNNEKQFPASAVKADLAYMYDQMEKSHYNLYAYVDKTAYKATFNKILQSVPQDTISLLDATKLFQRVAAIANVGHNEVDFPAPSYINYLQQGGTVFPLELALEDGKAYVSRLYTDNPNVKLGEQVLSIDNTPIKQLQQKIHPYLSAERPYFKDVKLELWSFPRYYWSVFGEREAFNVKVKTQDGQVKTYTIKAIPALDYETTRTDVVLNEDRSYKFNNGVAYLDPGPFSSSAEKGEEKFKAFIDSAFTDINAKNSRTLIVDLRNNSGGHNAFSDYLIAYFADKPFKWYSAFKLKTSELLKKQTRQTTPGLELDDYAQAILNHQNGEIFDFSFPVQEPMPEQKCFKGKVYVLVNRHTYSMAAVSAALIQDYGFAELVGEETGDVPTLYASQFSFPLPETGVIVKVPKGYIIRPNGDTQLRGVVPDHKVRDHLLDEQDEILNYTLQKLIQPTQSRH
ncbi:S41 family peptidase [Pontibacter sp. H249]|uniref:S41 family peptidase n=1 Tax=Pontibacter sp. H249 TaxID=3133420 RepID=UPI0030C2A1F2